MKKISFEETRALQLELLRELSAFCEQHQITYFIAYGTLLGAVRHGGFIPWDDDVDVMMPHTDFERFAALYKGDKFKVVFCKFEKEFGYSFGRFVNTETYSLYGKQKSYGVNLDIYPMYGCPDSSQQQQQHLKRYWRLVVISNFLIRVRSKLARMGLWPKKTFAFYINNFILRKQVQQLEKYPYRQGDSFYLNSGDRAIYPKSLVAEKCLLKFEDLQVAAPLKYDELLTLHYGDYMKLPPEENRVPYHHGDYFIKES